ncbi:STM4015 family protein [Spirillospora sp. NPDC127200]
MTLDSHLTEFAGLPVFSFDHETGEDELLPAEAEHAWAVRTASDDEEEPFGELWSRFRAAVDTTKITALVIGYWGVSYDSNYADPVALLVEAAADFPNLRSLFLGDIDMEELEISWIEHFDITPLFSAFPLLERFEMRGADGTEGELKLEPIKSTALKLLRLESGGLPGRVVRAVAASDLPNLEHLDLWLGEGNYGGDATVADLAPILSGERLPALRHLGLEDSEIQDEIAAAVAGAPIVARLETLSLAMGVLTDEGAEALLSGQPLTHLRKLDLSHHYLTDAMQERIRAALPGVEVDLNDQQNLDDEWRVVAVAE